MSCLQVEKGAIASGFVWDETYTGTGADATINVPASTVPVADRLALQSVPLDADSARLETLEAQLSARESELTTLKVELQQLQSRYLAEIGALYAQLSEIEADVAAAEIAAGLRPPPDADADDSEEPQADADEAPTSACGNRSAPSADLKRVFRDLAKTIHPDLAFDEATRYRRHSLMAEANRAYAERDEDRLRLILRKWERSPESVLGDDPESARLRVRRKIAEIEEHLLEIDAELADLRGSAIARLKNKIDETRRQGWDLFSEMVQQVKSDIARARARLVAAQRLKGRRQ